jgi:hypothetical protein
MAKDRKRPPKEGLGRSTEGTAEIGAERKFRGQAQRDRLGWRQHDAERADREGPQGKKDRNFQRKF